MELACPEAMLLTLRNAAGEEMGMANGGRPRLAPPGGRPSLRGRPRTQPEIAAFRRRALIAAAITSIARHGIADSTVERIAAAAGVSHGLIRHYFASKAELLAQAYQSLVDEFEAALAAEPLFHDADAVVRLEALIEVNFRPPVFQADRLSAWSGFWHAARTDEGLRAINRAFYDRYRCNVAALIRQAAGQRGLQLDETVAGDGLLAVMDGVWLEMMIDPAVFGPERGRLVCAQYLRRLFPA